MEEALDLSFDRLLMMLMMISEYILIQFLLLTTKSARENIYCDISDKIFNILKNSLQEPLTPIGIILVILFCSLKILLLYEEFPQTIIT